MRLVPLSAPPAHPVPAAPAAATPTPTGPSRVEGYVVDAPGRERFPLASRGEVAAFVVSDADHPGVVRVVGDLRDDVERVTGVRQGITSADDPAAVPGGDVVIVGTVGRSPLIADLVERGKLDVSGIAGRWETSLQQVVHDPLPGVRRAFVIAGSDQRGTIFGAYDVSREIGVSPWYWWADVPPAHRAELHVLPGRHGQGTPAVKYRGFFVNDENPALGTWAPGHFGPGHAPGFPAGFNHHFYAKVFETALRLKANYVWPAVWGRAFAEDDPLNHATAKAYGVVMGTSHEAPMMRGIEEWNRHARPGEGDPYGGNGEWSFRRNRAAIERYWADGVRRMKDEGFEGVVTLGMRGNGDASLSDGDGIELMREILASQRDILAREGMADVPQVQTLYKEVQRYWEQGLRPPDDVTVVFADDNWGNMRKLPDPSSPGRAGGHGLYYHFDYVGGGRNYKWVDTSPLANVRDQLHQSYEYGVDRLWVVNAGDVKGNELPLQFFLDYAWDPHRWPAEALGEWEERYAAQNFGSRAVEIASVLREYGALQSMRKPELLNRRATADGTAVTYDDQASPFSLTDYREIDRVTERWQRLADEAERIRGTLPRSEQDAYYQLVLYPVKATANLYALRLAEFTNLLYAEQGRASANALADITDARFADDRAMSEHYHTVLAGGKWNGFQTQPKIGYGDVARYGPSASWQQPERDDRVLPDEVFPAVRRVELPHVAELGVAVDGSDRWWPAAGGSPTLPAFSPHQSQPGQYVDVFNRGAVPFDYRVTSGAAWLEVDRPHGTVHEQVRLDVRVDWSRAPKGCTEVPVTITGAGAEVTVRAVVENDLVDPRGFVEANGYVSIEAAHATRVVDGDGVRWRRIPGLGRTGDGVQPFPVTAPSREPTGPRLEYELTVRSTGPVTVWAYLSPRNPVLPGRPGLRYGVSFDDQPPQVVDITAATGADDTAMNREWERNTSDNVNRTATGHHLAAGVHTLKVWVVDPTVVVQKLVVDTGGLRPSYLGPPESRRVH
ncbi:glycosyl hydrolase family 115 (putative glucuronidase) [Saccharothrix saharensis]|uniref:Glycosyl hydrolase family 115 (Putative glucuronidase) n=1 Tax=Saccharothrix saharensis TaxID=571190 RepID=A0A543J9G3_9PSEU|nr:glycosyl hydrolase 115 family protein [Saccharothrix saharensis]TQM79448.1 glycosyl hydrolase family 115 (putative glucuronidase) [Saccharothrix saharensis]